ncbi:MAG: EscU/YscU/HrcU family type III secretion system export apparatus switch protein [Thiogranum sp.]|nr:EscU/YscU/HrcU family type III secretion system export apparatus switch protein [Thiogranum sp.]
MSEKIERPPLAIALQYDGDRAPRVTAKGRDELAEQIIELAREHGIPMQENEPLAALLSRVDLGEEIPEALYIAVAQIIAFAYHLSGKAPRQE